MTTEERLRSVIHRYAESIEPGRDGWERIRARTVAHQLRSRLRLAIVAAATAAVLTIVVTAVTVVRSDDRDGTRVQTPPTGTTAAPREIVAATEDGRIVVLDATTGVEVRSLADGADAQTTIAVTPDGATVLFDRPSNPDADPPRELVAVRTGGGEAQRLIGGAGQPAISPDGQLFAFVRYSPRTDEGLPNGLNIMELPETFFEDWSANVVGDGTVGEADQQISGLSWAPDSRHLVYTLLSSPQGSYPRVTEISYGIRLDEAPIVPINDGSAVAGYLGDTGRLLGRTCVASEEPDQRLRVIAIDPQSGQETRNLFRYPEVCGSERLTSDSSGRHVLALGSAGLYRWSEGDAEPTEILDGVRSAAWVPASVSAAPDVTTTTTEVTPTVPSSTPASTPAGWQTIDYHGFRTALPPNWTVVRDGCPGRSRTLTLGPAPAACETPSATGAWIWLKPLPPDLGEDGRRCDPGFFNSVPGCQLIDGAGTETWFIDALDVALVAHTDITDRDYTTATFTWQYSDPTRPEASGPGQYQMAQPLFVAQDFARAYATANCPRLSELADRTYSGGCPTPVVSPDVATIGGASATAPGGAVHTTSYAVTIDPDGHQYQVTLQHEWSPIARRGEWKVASISD